MNSRFDLLRKVPYLMVGEVTFSRDGTIVNSGDCLAALLSNLARIFGPRAIEVNENKIFICYGGQILALDLENETWEVEDEI